MKLKASVFTLGLLSRWSQPSMQSSVRFKAVAAQKQLRYESQTMISLSSKLIFALSKGPCISDWKIYHGKLLIHSLLNSYKKLVIFIHTLSSFPFHLMSKSVLGKKSIKQAANIGLKSKLECWMMPRKVEEDIITVIWLSFTMCSAQ